MRPSLELHRHLHPHLAVGRAHHARPRRRPARAARRRARTSATRCRSWRPRRVSVEPAGLEPATSALQGGALPAELWPLRDSGSGDRLVLARTAVFSRTGMDGAWEAARAQYSVQRSRTTGICGYRRRGADGAPWLARSPPSAAPSSPRRGGWGHARQHRRPERPPPSDSTGTAPSVGDDGRRRR